MAVAPTVDHVRSRRPLWASLAACRGVGVDLFYSDEPEDIADAKALCSRCEVRELCREYAATWNDSEGLWGGETAEERQRHLEDCHLFPETAPYGRETAPVPG